MQKRFRMPKLTIPPVKKAEFEIMGLMSAPELQTDVVFGGPTPPKMLAENERRNKEYRRRRLAIIAKHGVADEYLKPAYEEKKRLSTELARVRKEIADLEKIRRKRGGTITAKIL